MEATIRIATQAARRAGQIIMRYFHQLDTVKISEKQENDFVSAVDIQAEQVIIDTIHHMFPDHGILAEESGSLNPENDVCWIIDPLDGTTNYLHGFPHFSVSIAVQHKQRLEHAVIYDPIRDDLFTASRGKGARLNNRRLRVNSINQLSKALLGTGFPVYNQQLAEQYLATFRAFFGKCAGIRRSGSAALDLAYVAAGKLDGFWEFALNPWDVAAGVLLVQEAGGLVCDVHGGEDYLTNGTIVAGSPKIVKALLQRIQPITSI